jgi:hypothetical protein
MIATEAYLELLISGIFEFQHPLSSTLGEEISRYLGYVVLLITLVILPGLMVGILTYDKSYL